MPAPKRHFVVRPPLAHSAPTPPSTSRAAPRSMDPVRTCHCRRCYATILIGHPEASFRERARELASESTPWI
ncbi:MAG: hypothetical protein KAI66_27270, partial [Lentisphaeria bacterium]|nr:hypothetical protein [Lentisphaeria bacterium]